jgi:ubiquinone/menaquinone biosynthesis C-methylase UbiE
VVWGTISAAPLLVNTRATGTGVVSLPAGGNEILESPIACQTEELIPVVDQQLPEKTAAKEIENIYCRRFSNRSYDFFGDVSIFGNQTDEREFLHLMKRYSLFPLNSKLILDVGTGGGFFLRSLLKYGVHSSHLFGLDFWEARVQDGHAIAPCIPLICGAAEMLPFPNDCFDVVVQRTMLSSILDGDTRLQAAREMLRVVKPGGIIASHDFRVKRPGDHDVCSITAKELRRLFADGELTLFSAGLPPQLERMLAPRSFLACQFLSTIWPSPLRCFYWAIVRKGAVT